MTRSLRNRASSIGAALAGVPALLDSMVGFNPRTLGITEREYLCRVLDFTAWDGENVEQLAALELAIRFGGNLADRNGQPLPLGAGATELPNPCPPDHALFYRDMFRRHLADRVAGVHRWDFGTYIDRNMLVRPAGISSRRGRGVLAVYLPRDLSTGVEYALSLLFDEERSYGGFLRPCEFPTCGGYFLRSDKGGKPAKYHDACRKRLRSKSRHRRRKTQEP